jgi:hypothetical protein
LFSSSEVANRVNEQFEPAWDSVRPAPLVTIDFGNGHTVRRTLQGNIATYVCGPDGAVYDVLPGIYTPAIYCRQLEACKRLADSLGVKLKTGGEKTRSDSLERPRDYHARQAALLKALPQSSQMRAIAQTGGGFKGGFGGGFAVSANQLGLSGGFVGGGAGFSGIEGPIQRVIVGRTEPPAAPVSARPGPLATRPELDLDAQVNERIRRRLIHERLATASVLHPDDIKKWLFKEVLHVDLDDPLLGLGAVLSDNYPFADEDNSRVP